MNENENVREETQTNDLGDVIDTDVSGGTLEFVKENAAGLAVIIMAGYGCYFAIKNGVNFIKSKIPARDPEKTILKRQKRSAKKKMNAETPENES